MEIVQSLFDLPTISPSERKESLAAERKRKASLAYRATAPAWREAYSAFIVRYLSENPPAIAETIRLEYEKTKLPQIGGDKRAAGNLFNDLVKAGKIRRTGEFEMSAIRCSPMGTYTI